VCASLVACRRMHRIIGGIGLRLWTHGPYDPYAPGELSVFLSA
jgi:hypothetical protein